MRNKVLVLLIGLIYSMPSFAQTEKVPQSSQIIDWNDQIDLKSRNQIKILNDQLISSFYEPKASKLISLYSERLNKKAANKTDALVQNIHSLVGTTSYAVFD